MDDTPRANGLPPGYITFPAAVWVWQGIIRPSDETRSMAQFDRFAGDLIQAVWDARLKAYCIAGTIIEAKGLPPLGEALRKILNGDVVELRWPHVASPTTGIVAFLSEAVAVAAGGAPRSDGPAIKKARTIAREAVKSRRKLTKEPKQ